ncbi:MAG: hypothetical protein KJ064_15930 [Anaerolineae bacterium]|nr:hypothetical protein [Anaerolineae bacterium]
MTAEALARELVVSPRTIYRETFESARRYLLSWGRAVEVLEPLRKSVLDFARQIVDYYDRR